MPYRITPLRHHCTLLPSALTSSPFHTLLVPVAMATSSSDKGSAFDPKKRALEALERRFTFSSKAESETKRRKGTKKIEKEGGGGGGDAAEVSAEPKSSSSKIGNFVFCGSQSEKASHTASARDPAYLELPNNFHENILPGEKPTHSAMSAVHKVVHDLLQNGEAAQKYMQGSRSMKIGNWFLLDKFVPNDFSSAAAHVKALRDHSKRSKSHMSMKQHRKLGSFNLSVDSQKHELFKPLHELWKDYIMKLLKETGKNQMPQHLLAADLHGAILLVVQCRQQAALVGTNGFMIRETAETFGIITEDDKFRVVPKKGSVFIFQAGCFKVTIIGDKFSRRDTGM